MVVPPKGVHIETPVIATSFGKWIFAGVKGLETIVDYPGGF